MAAGTKGKFSKTAYRRAKKKELQQKADTTESTAIVPVTGGKSPTSTNGNGVTPAPAAPTFAVDLSDLNFDFDDPALADEFRRISNKFNQAGDEQAAGGEAPADKPELFLDEDDDIQDEEQEAETQLKLSKKAQKEKDKYTVAQLKELVRKPELVEWTDVSSREPLLLLALKSAKNAVPVPSHWSLKREYLSSKRGIEKPLWKLPKFIADTGIQEIRDAHHEKQENMTLKQKQRERVQGKVGKMDLDYEKIWDAFFRRQTKPDLTHYGEVYYEGKEYETNLRHLRPGILSDELMEALGMAPGTPPPWLVMQQQWGPPPSYPGLKIPGVNAPPPPGQSWGYAAGQWGKPPLNEDGTSKFGGDLYGTAAPAETALQQPTHAGDPVERARWGALHLEGESDDEEEQAEVVEEDDSSDSEPEDGPRIAGIRTSFTGTQAVPISELGAPDSGAADFTLRKQRKGIETEDYSAPRTAGQVIPERNINAQGFFGGERAYDINAAKKDRFGEENTRKRKAGDVDVSVDIDSLQNDRLDSKDLRKAYEAEKKAEAHSNWEAVDQDYLDEMIAFESRKRVKREEDRRGKR